MVPYDIEYGNFCGGYRPIAMIRQVNKLEGMLVALIIYQCIHAEYEALSNLLAE